MKAKQTYQKLSVGLLSVTIIVVTSLLLYLKLGFGRRDVEQKMMEQEKAEEFQIEGDWGAGELLQLEKDAAGL